MKVYYHLNVGLVCGVCSWAMSGCDDDEKPDIAESFRRMRYRCGNTACPQYAKVFIRKPLEAEVVETDEPAWIEVESKNLARVCYDKTSAHLLIQFHSGGTYRYEGVSQTTLDELLRADSKNTYFRANIKDKYPCEKVT